MSRSLNENNEWQLSPTIFKKIVRTFDFEPEIENYISCFPDNKARIIDAFGIDWTDFTHFHHLA